MASAVISGCPEEPGSPLHSGGLPGVAGAGGRGAAGDTEPVVRPGILNGNQLPSAACAKTWPDMARVIAAAALSRPVDRNNLVMASAFAAIPGNRNAGLRGKMQLDRALRVAIVDSFSPKRQGECYRLRLRIFRREIYMVSIPLMDFKGGILAPAS